MKWELKKLAVGACALLLLGAGSAWADFQTGGDHLVDNQNSDGGWTWEHGDGNPATGLPSPPNTMGPIGLGLLNTYSHTGDVDHLNSAIDAADYVLSTTYPVQGETRFSTSDPYFLLRLSQAAPGLTSYADAAATGFFDTLSAGTYGDANYTTATWIAAVQTARTGVWVNLRPWEFSTLAYTADQIGNAGQGDLFEAAIIAGLGTLSSDSNTAYNDILGLSGGLYGLGLRGTDLSAGTSVGDFGTVADTEALATLLASLQNANGSWDWASDLATPGLGDQDTQTTAYATLALLAADAAGFGDWSAEIASARNWLWSMQLPGGGFYSYGDQTGENHEIEGEALQAVPEPMSMAMLGCLGVGMFAARRKRKKA